MLLGLYADTHGLHHRDALNHLMHDLPPEQMRTIDNARRCEEVGFDSMWFADHLFMPIESQSSHKANISGTRAYRPRHTMMDAAVTMAAVAASTQRLKLATSVLIAPYRPPLSDARQFATLDILSGGRLILGVGAGWMREEFDAVGRPFEHRGAITEECIEIYKRCWTHDVVEFHGDHYDFTNLSMDPKPLQKPHPPIVFGGVVPAGARRAARCCDGLYMTFLDVNATPGRYQYLQDEARRELERVGRDPAEFAMQATVSIRLLDAAHPDAQEPSRRLGVGSPEQVLADIAAFAANGYAHFVCFFECPRGDPDELRDQIEQFAADVLPAARALTPAGDWRKDL